MIIQGAKYWNAKNEDPDEDYYSIQTNNSLNRIVNKAAGRTGKLEWCGPETGANCGGAMIGWKALQQACTIGSVVFQFGDLLGLYFHEPSRYPAFKQILDRDWEKGWPNRYIILYAQAIWDLLHIRTGYVDRPPVWKLKDHVCRGGTVQLCLKEPGHYRSLKAYNLKKDTFIADDPWPEGNEGEGCSITMTHTEIVENTIGLKLLYFPKE